jgi:hypothetical protein
MDNHGRAYLLMPRDNVLQSIRMVSVDGKGRAALLNLISFPGSVQVSQFLQELGNHTAPLARAP